MSRPGRVMAIFAIAGLAAVVVVGTLARRSHGDDFRRARAEIVRWEARWAAARECLLGNAAPQTRTRDALAIREMDDDWKPADCAALVGKLTREPSADSGIDAVEAAWRDLDKAAVHTATAFARHISHPLNVAEGSLPEALDAFDAAYVALRTAAKLPPLESPPAPLRSAQLLLIHDEGVTSIEVDAVPSAHGLVVFGKSATRDVQIVLTTGGEPRAAFVRDGSLRGVPDLSWGAVVEPEAIHAGLFDPKGFLGADFDGKGRFSTKGTPAILAALGTITLGTLAFTSGTSLVLAHIADHTIAADPAIAITSATSASDVDGRAAVVWTSRGDEVHGRILRPGDDGTPVDLPGMPIGPFCLTERAAWARTESGMVSFGDGRLRVVQESGLGDLAGCAQDAALVRNEYDPHKVFVCTDDCHSVDIPAGAPRGRALTLVGKELVAIATHSGVLGVWRTGAAPIYYSLPEPVIPVAALDMTALAMSDGTVIDLLAQARTEYVVIRVPAR